MGSGGATDLASQTTSAGDATVAEVRLTRETVDYIEGRMAEAVRAGITAAMNETNAEAFWAAGLSVLQKRANEHAGRFVIGSLWELARKAAAFVLLGGIVYAVGGWQALAGLAKLLVGKG